MPLKPQIDQSNSKGDSVCVCGERVCLCVCVSVCLCVCLCVCVCKRNRQGACKSFLDLSRPLSRPLPLFPPPTHTHFSFLSLTCERAPVCLCCCDRSDKSGSVCSTSTNASNPACPVFGRKLTDGTFAAVLINLADTAYEQAGGGWRVYWQRREGRCVVGWDTGCLRDGGDALPCR